jgi:hypothetical protein
MLSEAVVMIFNKKILFSPVFICLLPLLYYIDYARILFNILGLPRLGEYDPSILLVAIQHGLPFRIWSAWVIYPAIYLIYAIILYKNTDRIQNAIKEPFKKLLPIVLPILMTVVIIVNVVMGGGNSNSTIMTKLAWCWGLGVLLIIIKMIDIKKLIGNSADS